MSSPCVAFLAPMKSELRPLVKKLSLERVERGDAIFHTGRSAKSRSSRASPGLA